MKTIRIGSGAGFAGDRIEPALAIMDKGNIDYIIFECLAERTIALAQMEKIKDPTKGYNILLENRMNEILPLMAEKKIKVITNMGAANPVAAVKVVKKLAVEKGLTDIKIAAVLGDDVFPSLHKYMDQPMLETGNTLQSIKSKLVSANAYIGVDGIVQALQNEADIVITGRVADPSLVLAPLVYEFGWDKAAYDLLGKGTMAGHLLECAAQVTGGYFADPAYKDVPDLWNVGFPIAEVSEKGDVIISKLEQAGGMVTPATVKEQIVYEIHDPSRYLTPDVIADFSQVSVEEIEPNKVAVSGVSGKEKSGYYKTSVGYKDCFIIDGEISYGGPGAYERAKAAAEIISKRIKHNNIQVKELRTDFIGVNSLFTDENSVHHLNEIRLRVAARTVDKRDADKIGTEIESLYTNGPAGGGGVKVTIRENISIASLLIPSDDVQIELMFEEV